jgi:hypothetical protein
LGTDSKEIVEKIQAFASVGVQTLVVTGNTGNIAEFLPAMDRLAREVLPVFVCTVSSEKDDTLSS